MDNFPVSRVLNAKLQSVIAIIYCWLSNIFTGCCYTVFQAKDATLGRNAANSKGEQSEFVKQKIRNHFQMRTCQHALLMECTT